MRQLRSPLLLLLIFAAAASVLSGEWLDAAIVLTIVVVTVGIGYSREYSAQTAAAALRARVCTRATVLRDRIPEQIPAGEIVPGDVVLLGAGSLVPADGVVLAATDVFVGEAVLNGIAYDAAAKRLFVTGKNWPQLYEIEVTRPSGCSQTASRIPRRPCPVRNWSAWMAGCARRKRFSAAT